MEMFTVWWNACCRNLTKLQKQNINKRGRVNCRPSRNHAQLGHTELYAVRVSQVVCLSDIEAQLQLVFLRLALHPGTGASSVNLEHVTRHMSSALAGKEKDQAREVLWFANPSRGLVFKEGLHVLFKTVAGHPGGEYAPGRLSVSDCFFNCTDGTQLSE